MIRRGPDPVCHRQGHRARNPSCSSGQCGAAEQGAFRLFAHMAAQFPPLDQAREDGLLCMGGDLSAPRLLAAYSLGIFPWYEEGLPILWWSPDPRCVLPLQAFQLPRRSARAIRHAGFELSLDRAFDNVIQACAGPRHGSRGTWITAEMLRAYKTLHRLGYVHSVEVWKQGELVGGLYGVALGRAFFGESMFHLVPEASRAALAGLVTLLRQRGALLLDCQQETPHIMRMGGQLVPRAFFLNLLRQALAPDCAGQTEGCPVPASRTGALHSSLRQAQEPVDEAARQDPTAGQQAGMWQYASAAVAQQGQGATGGADAGHGRAAVAAVRSRSTLAAVPADSAVQGPARQGHGTTGRAGAAGMARTESTTGAASVAETASVAGMAVTDSSDEGCPSGRGMASATEQPGAACTGCGSAPAGRAALAPWLPWQEAYDYSSSRGSWIARS